MRIEFYGQSEIDGKFSKHDFIGSTVSCNDTDTQCTTDYFPVLDPYGKCNKTL